VFKSVVLYIEDASTNSNNSSPDAFYNMVFYASDMKSVTFRKPGKGDMTFPGVYARMLDKFYDSAVDLPANGDETYITDINNPLGALQVDSARKHWKVMRKLFGDMFWTEAF
jgi:sugar phosphate isomerase/epimerase